MSGHKIQAVVFDVDGTLLDTERLTQQTWLAVSRGMGWPQVGEEYLEFIGRNRADIRRKMLDDFGPEFPQEQFFQACSQYSQARIAQNGVPLKAGVREILDLLKLRGVPMALATSTSALHTTHRMELTGLGSYFQAVVTGDQVSRGKPDPEIYLTACQKLGVGPQFALAVEDSRSGIRSAHGAGMPVAMIPDLIPPTPELEELLWGRFDSLLALRDRLSALL